MPSITCPKCNQSYNIDAASIGKQCECPCGHSFIAQVNPTAPAATTANPKQTLASNHNPKRRAAYSGVSFIYRILSLIGLVGGIILIILGIIVPIISKNEETAVMIPIGLGALISILPLYTFSEIIESIFQIQENTRIIAERLNQNNE